MLYLVFGCWQSRHSAVVVGDRRRPDEIAITQGRPVPESECRRLFQQLTVAVDYCHRLGIANRDIKLDNLLLQPSRDGGPPNLKMCDVRRCLTPVRTL